MVGNKVHQDWDSTATGWRKWDSFIMNWLKPVGEKILDSAGLEETLVLDVATGSGEPGLSAARRLTKGWVIGLDISEEMLKTAKEKAGRARLMNYESDRYSVKSSFHEKRKRSSSTRLARQG